MAEVRAKKSLGQHFLRDRNIALKIVESLNACQNTNVLEIGPGMGVLTRILITKDINLKVVEIDTESISYLSENLPEIKEKIISEDVLKLDLSNVFPTDFSIIGNLPYNISSQILFHILSNRNMISEAVFMIQKEVAERICATSGSKTYGILSVILQTFFEIKILFHVGPKVFLPPPKVNSSVIKMVQKKSLVLPCDEHLFIKVVKQSFNQRRKTLRNSLKPLLPDNLDTSTALFNKRAEQLPKEEFWYLTQLIQKNQNQ